MHHSPCLLIHSSSDVTLPGWCRCTTFETSYDDLPGARDYEDATMNNMSTSCVVHLWGSGATALNLVNCR